MLIERFSETTKNFIRGKEIKNSIEKAHSDMSRRAAGHKEQIKMTSVCLLEKHFVECPPYSVSSQDEFDKWHEETCNKYCNGMNNSGSAFNFTYGRAQKVLNMTFKYLYCTDAYKAKIEPIAPYLHMTLDGYTLRWYKNVVVDYLNNKCFENIKSNAISEWSKINNNEHERSYINIQKDIRKYLADSQNYQYVITTKVIADNSLQQQEGKDSKNILYSIPFDKERRGPFFAEFIVWEGEIVRAKTENLFNGLNDIYRSWEKDEWAINDDIKQELKSKISAIYRRL